jgi:UDP-3-O-[3-hydroxymyristoyl] glucosamine N-acyltransferase
MRLHPLAALVLGMTLAVPALAADKAPKKSNAWRVVCATNSKDGSRAVQGSDLIIEKGEKVKDAVAVDGNVILRAGAEVEDAIAVQGRVIVEPGARVRGEAVTIGGEIHVYKGAHVDGDATALGGQLVLDAEDGVAGKKSSLSLQIGGRDLLRGFIEDALGEDNRCHIIDDEKDS